MSSLPFPYHWVNAVGWALLHSLWQLMLVWGLAVLLLRLLRPYPAAWRYRLLMGLWLSGAMLALWTCYCRLAGPAEFLPVESLPQPGLIKPHFMNPDMAPG